MNNGILYYPSIEFKDEDYNWLIRASLLWDKIYRIVPEGYTPKDNKQIKELCSSGDIGVKYPLGIEHFHVRHDASVNFLNDYGKKLSDFDKALKKDKKFPLDRISSSKATTLLQLVLEEHHLIEYKQDGWFYVPKILADIYLTYLATEIAKRENFSLATPNSDVWIMSFKNIFNTDRFINETFSVNDIPDLNLYPELLEIIVRDFHDDFISSAFSFPIYIDNIFPEYFDIEPSKILKFRELRKDERKNFIRAYENFCDQLSKAHSPTVIRDIWETERKEIEKAISDYKKSMDLIKVTKWGGRISLLGAVIVDALGYTGIADNILQIANSALLGIGTGATIVSNFIPNPKNPYTYLCQIHDLVRKKLKQPLKTIPIDSYKEK